ncbi:MAG: GntR family transcriptional regulator [Pontimonas sp.]
MAELESRLTSEEVYLELRRRILEHTLPPATRINIRAISMELGVSSTPVREALRQLQGDNLLVGTSNKGYATTDVLDARGVRALFEFRLLVEPWAASAAAANRLGNPAHELSQEIASFDPHAGPVNLMMIRHDSAFHQAIVRATDNPVLVDSYDWKRSVDQHREIARAIELAQPEDAERAMRRHLHDAYLGFIEGLSSDGDGPLRTVMPELVIDLSDRTWS